MCCRAGCIRALKAKWDFVNEEYQKGSTLDLKKLDTMSKVRAVSLHRRCGY
jgi:hypothetical protein